jgi:hypothetical protein
MGLVLLHYAEYSALIGVLMKRKILTIGVFLVFLGCGGCGGGGGEGDNSSTDTPAVIPAPQDLDVQVASTVSSMDENTSGQITLSYVNANGDVNLTVSDFSGDFQSDQYTVTAVNADKQITVVMNDVYVDGDLTFTVTATDSSNTDSVSITLSVANTSVVPTLEKLSVLTNIYDDIINVSEGRKVLSQLNELEALLGLVDESTSLARMQSIDSLLNQTAALVLADNLENIDYSTLYSKGMSELDLNRALTAVELNLPLYSEDLYNLINEVQQSLGENLIAPFLGNSFYVDSTKNTVSRFWMNPSMGEVVDGNYQFSEKYAYIEAVIFPETKNCYQ